MNRVDKVKRGDVVLLPIAFVSGQGTKVRPAVVVQNDELNNRLNSTVVAIITSTNVRSQHEPSQLYIDIAMPEGKDTGLLHSSTIKTEHLDTVDQRDIVRVIGRLPESTMSQLEACIRSALGFSA